MNKAERAWYEKHCYPADKLPQWAHAWHALYAGRLVADDIEALASDLEKSADISGSPDRRANAVLVTLQQSDAVAFLEVRRVIALVLENAYARLCDEDPRWASPWSDVELTLNPNGPMVHAGSDGDNGQTGRKLAMDFYGPRIPIGGGALSGKHLTHIDRIGAYAAREAALRAVRAGAGECLVRVAWAPNRPEPLDVFYDMAGRGQREGTVFFHHGSLAERYEPGAITMAHARGGHFYDTAMPWNGY